MKPNMLLNILGFTLIFIAVIGLAVHPGEGEAEEEKELGYGISFHKHGDGGPPLSGSVNDGGRATPGITFSEQNLVTINFSFDWSDDRPVSILSSVSVVITITSPEGESQTQSSSGSSGSASISFSRPEIIPENSNIHVKKGENATEAAEGMYPVNETWTGQWSVEITADRSPRNTFIWGISWSISTDIEYFDMHVNRN